jgi:hypothetical protein
MPFRNDEKVFQPVSYAIVHYASKTDLFRNSSAYLTMRKTFHVIERQIVLKNTIDYYSFHLDGFQNQTGFKGSFLKKNKIFLNRLRKHNDVPCLKAM